MGRCKNEALVYRSAIAIAVVWLACGQTLAAAADDEGVTVIGSGEARGRPNAFEFFTRISGASELGSDALVKFREFKRRTAEAVDKLQLVNGEVTFGGFSLTSAGNVRGRRVNMFRVDLDGEESFKPEIMFSSLVRVCVRGIDRLPEEQVPEKISDLLDRLKDGGVTIEAVQGNAETPEFEAHDGFGAPPVALFVLEDATEIRRLARKRAFEAARESAEELAQLAGLALGPVVSMQEVGGQGEPWLDVLAQGAFEASQAGRRGKLRLTSSTMSEFSVRASLQVRFRLRAKEGATP